VTGAAPVLQPISCPACGGSAGRIAPGDIRTCPYCDVPLTLVAPGVAGSTAILPAFDEDRARQIVERFLESPGAPETLREGALRRGIELMFVPFFDILLVQAAEEAPPVRCRLAVVRFTSLALDDGARDLGADRIDPDRVRATATVPYDAVELTARGSVLEPQRRPEAIRLPTIMSEPVSIERRVKVVYYPVWLARFSYGHSLYHVAVDGTTGEILRGVAPASMKRRVLAGVGFTLLFSLLTAAALANPRIVFRLMAHAGDVGAFVAGSLLLVLATAWDRLRFRRELLIEGSTRRQMPVNRPKETTLESIARFLLSAAKSRGRAYRPRGWE